MIQLVFCNLFCQSFWHTHNISVPSFPSMCLDNYFSGMRPLEKTWTVWDPTIDLRDLFITTNCTKAWVQGHTTEVNLQGTGFSFLCGDQLYFVLPRSWSGFVPL
jgi:hypothetical protein